MKQSKITRALPKFVRLSRYIKEKTPYISLSVEFCHGFSDKCKEQLELWLISFDKISGEYIQGEVFYFYEESSFVKTVNAIKAVITIWEEQR